MHQPGMAEFLELVAARRGHFQLESGHHSALWLDLDSLFADPPAITPFADALTAALRPHRVEAVCGPLLGGAFLAQLIAPALGAEFIFTERVVPPRTDALYQVQYRLPRALRERVAGRRVAIVDDVMSAGSALRGTYAALRAHAALPVVAGALLMLGTVGADFFAQQEVAVAAVLREAYNVWTPADCPLCAASMPLEQVTFPEG